MAKLIGNYTVPGQTDKREEDLTVKKEDTVGEFERKAMARLGGSIAFVMKGKNVIWNGTPSKDGADQS